MADIEEYECSEWGETRACLEVRYNMLETAFAMKVYKVGTVKCETIANRVIVNDNPNPAPDEAQLGDIPDIRPVSCIGHSRRFYIGQHTLHDRAQGGEHYCQTI